MRRYAYKSMNELLEQLKELKSGYKKAYEEYVKATYNEQNKFVRVKRR